MNFTTAPTDPQLQARLQRIIQAAPDGLIRNPDVSDENRGEINSRNLAVRGHSLAVMMGCKFDHRWGRMQRAWGQGMEVGGHYARSLRQGSPIAPPRPNIAQVVKALNDGGADCQPLEALELGRAAHESFENAKPVLDALDKASKEGEE